VQTVVIKADGKAGIVTISVTAPTSAGSPVTFEYPNLSSGFQQAFDSTNSNKVVVAYGKINGNSNYGTAIVGTVDPSAQFN